MVSNSSTIVRAPKANPGTASHTTTLSTAAARSNVPRPCSGEERRRWTRELLETASQTDADQAHDLRQQAVLLNISVAEEIAARYNGRGVALDDLRQVAYEGLILAVRRFDVNREGDLLSFAIPTIRGEIRRYFRDHGWTIRPPRRIQELQSRIQLTYGELVQELGREPTTRELSDELGVSEAELGETYCAYGCYSLLSLDRPATDDSATTVGDLVEGEDSGHTDSENRLLLIPAVQRLSERDRRILHLRYYEELTQKEIGAMVGITQMQVSRVLRRILATLRDELSSAAA